MEIMQAYIDGLSREWQGQRARTQITLGRLIAILAAMPADEEIENLRNIHSYRGYYCDLALELKPGKRKVKELLEESRAAMGKVFTGYKGGDFLMGESTPLWVADYGTTGSRLMDISQRKVILAEEDI